MKYFYLIAYDYCIDDGEPTGGYEILFRNKKISEEANVRLVIERILRGIRDEVAEDSATTISRVHVIPKNIQLLE